MRLDLGSGNKKRPGFDAYIDIADFGFNDIADFEKDDLPYKDNSINYIHSNQVIEHIRDVKHILNECWRILKPGGTFEIIVPYYKWDGASKPVHHQHISVCWFDFLRRPDIWKWYGYRRWEIIKLDELKKHGEVYNIRCILTPDKNV